MIFNLISIFKPVVICFAMSQQLLKLEVLNFLKNSNNSLLRFAAIPTRMVLYYNNLLSELAACGPQFPSQCSGQTLLGRLVDRATSGFPLWFQDVLQIDLCGSNSQSGCLPRTVVPRTSQRHVTGQLLYGCAAPLQPRSIPCTGRLPLEHSTSVSGYLMHLLCP